MLTRPVGTPATTNSDFTEPDKQRFLKGSKTPLFSHATACYIKGRASFDMQSVLPNQSQFIDMVNVSETSRLLAMLSS